MTLPVIQPPNNVFMSLRLNPLGKLEYTGAETGIAGVSGLGSGAVAVTCVGGTLTNLQPSDIIARVAALLAPYLPTGNPPFTFTQRWSVDLVSSVVSTY